MEPPATSYGPGSAGRAAVRARAAAHVQCEDDLAVAQRAQLEVPGAVPQVTGPRQARGPAAALGAASTSG